VPSLCQQGGQTTQRETDEGPLGRTNESRGKAGRKSGGPKRRGLPRSCRKTLVDPVQRHVGGSAEGVPVQAIERRRALRSTGKSERSCWKPRGGKLGGCFATQAPHSTAFRRGVAPRLRPRGRPDLFGGPALWVVNNLCLVRLARAELLMRPLEAQHTRQRVWPGSRKAEGCSHPTTRRRGAWRIRTGQRGTLWQRNEPGRCGFLFFDSFATSHLVEEKGCLSLPPDSPHGEGGTAL